MTTKLYFTLIFQILVNFMLNPNYCVCLDFNSNAEDIEKLPVAWIKDIIASNEWNQWEESNKNLNECNKIKSKQSPIDLYETGDCKDRHKIFITKGSCSIDSLQFSITPQNGLRADFPKKNSNCLLPRANPSFSTPKVKPSHFEIKIPSQHTIQGIEYDAEMSIYHTRKDGKGIIAISILFDADGAHKDFRPLNDIIDQWNKVVESESFSKTSHVYYAKPPVDNTKDNLGMTLRAKIHQRSQMPDYTGTNPGNSTWNDKFPELTAPFNVYQFMPTDYFYSYLGSLTVPPCSEIVDWHVTDRPLLVSLDQMEKIRQLLGTAFDKTYIKDMNRLSRPIQGNSEGRKVAHCTSANFKGNPNKQKPRLN